MLKIKRISLWITAVFALALTDTILLVRLSQSRSTNDKLTSEVRELRAQSYVYERYIVKNFRYSDISAEMIYQELSELDETIFLKDFVFVVLLPNGACEACANALFERLDAENCPKDRLFLIPELPKPTLKREWQAHGFGPVGKGCQNIFERLGMHSEILLLKLNKNNRTVKLMICEPAYIKFLPTFLSS